MLSIGKKQRLIHASSSSKLNGKNTLQLINVPKQLLLSKSLQQHHMKVMIPSK
jgi:hypothetical protein